MGGQTRLKISTFRPGSGPMRPHAAATQAGGESISYRPAYQERSAGVPPTPLRDWTMTEYLDLAIFWPSSCPHQASEDVIRSSLLIRHAKPLSAPETDNC